MKKLFYTLCFASAAWITFGQLVVSPNPAPPPPLTYRVTLDNEQSTALLNALSSQIQLSGLVFTNLARLTVSASVTTTNGLRTAVTIVQWNKN